MVKRWSRHRGGGTGSELAAKIARMLERIITYGRTHVSGNTTRQMDLLCTLRGTEVLVEPADSERIPVTADNRNPFL